ncbi:MAG: TIGR01777 family protein [Nitrospinae bacterium]|nr:TIGR01777 family protein [Nitrospinota bacterium]
MKNILITGGTGLVGKHLTELLLTKGYNVSVLSRSPKKQANQISYYRWDVSRQYIDENSLIAVDAVIHLAGANIGDKRWTKNRKQEILESRVDSTNLLFQSIQKQNPELKKFICASAIGYYGTVTSYQIFSEESDAGGDFLANVCASWESEALKCQGLGVSTSIVRNGIVLAKEDGALPKMAFPAKLGLYSPIGSGQQYMPWIHIQDLCNMYLFLLEHPKIDGVFNAVSSEHISNSSFSRVLTNVLNRPFFMPNIPAFFIRLMFGEMAVILLNGSRVDNQKIKEAGFSFEFDNLKSALTNLLA